MARNQREPKSRKPHAQESGLWQRLYHHNILGFPTIELLAAIVAFAGLSAAITLPTTPCEPPPRDRSEANVYVSSMNRAQQAFYLEKNTFSSSLTELGLGMESQTSDFKYSIRATPKTAFNYGIARNTKEFSYVGAIYVVPAVEIDSKATAGESTTVAILCRSTEAGPLRPTEPTYTKGSLTCASGTLEIYRSY